MRAAGADANLIGTAFMLAVVEGAVGNLAFYTAKMLFAFAAAIGQVYVFFHRYSPFPQALPA